MKEQLIKLSNKKGFISKIIGKSVTAKYSEKPFYYLWMCELQKWLRDKHNLHITINIMTYEDSFIIYIEPFQEIQINTKSLYSSSEHKDGVFKTYEEALEKGLQEALKLIEDEKI